jgi:hypothetical protein
LLLGYLCSVLLRARDHWRAGALEPTPYVNSAQGVQQFGFWGAFARLPTSSSSSTTTTPDCLQRLLCYDDNNDNIVDPGSSNAIGNSGYLFLSLIFIYVLFFMSVLYGSFLYACSKIVLFIMINYIYAIMFKPSILWIKIMWKLLNFPTALRPWEERAGEWEMRALRVCCSYRQSTKYSVFAARSPPSDRPHRPDPKLHCARTCTHNRSLLCLLYTHSCVHRR